MSTDVIFLCRVHESLARLYGTHLEETVVLHTIGNSTTNQFSLHTTSFLVDSSIMQKTLSA